ncbi:hypothetical protein F511_38197 [Dorcoceras hygrometricum]|uniref:Uncharacterized protein n=1 Tax=Dorcoceras hygrometricum TaxID=472368 RepID=A0A2Z7D524_9LAMI|nr:hypothetical protein F511_38197 [Dorcoceras hygrometricum]
MMSHAGNNRAGPIGGLTNRANMTDMKWGGPTQLQVWHPDVKDRGTLQIAERLTTHQALRDQAVG